MIKLFAADYDNNLFTEYIRYNGTKSESPYNSSYTIQRENGTYIQISGGCLSEMINIKLGEKFEEPSKENNYLMTVTNFRFDQLKNILAQNSTVFPGYTIEAVLKRVQILRSFFKSQVGIDYLDEFLPLSIEDLEEMIDNYQNNKLKGLIACKDIFQKKTVTPTEVELSEIDKLKLSIEKLNDRLDKLSAQIK